MNVLSLFSGIGGLDLGLERAGMTVAGQVEIDPWCRSILAKHWPEVPRHDDVRTAARWWGSRPVDLVCGGFPCQPVSLAGKGLAQADSRWLWPATRDVIRDLRPRWVLLENVPGLLGRGMGDVLGDLAGLGYDAEWDCVPAAFVGAPHIRNRVFIVAYPTRVSGTHRSQHDPGELVGAVDRAGGRTDGRDPAARTGELGRSTAVLAPTMAYPQRDAGDERRPGDAGKRPGGRHADRGAVGAHVADAASCGRDDSRLNRSGTSQGHDTRPPMASQSRGSRRSVAYADSTPRRPARPAGQEVFRPSEVERPRRCGCCDGHTWPAEPGVGRVANGIPRRVDRLRGLGNAVVPQVAEHIGRLIMEAAA